MMTEQQKRAVEAEGRVIVSASAGSGKTFVMIERLSSLIVNGGDLREVLAVTFTNKAAAQMKERLRSALLKCYVSSDDEGKERLRGQLNFLPSAEISTIHAFCGRLVRTYFYLADVDPAFRIVSPDEGEGLSLSARALDETFEKAYRDGGEFADLLEVYFRKKKDARLRETVLSVYNAARGLADYRARLAAAGQESLESLAAYLAEDLSARARSVSARAQELLEKFGPSSRAAKQCMQIKEAAEALKGGLFELREAAAVTPAIANTPSMTKSSGEELCALRALSSLSKEVKALYAGIREYGAEEDERELLADANRRAAALSALVLCYDDAYSALKKEAGVLDYNDLEHYALRILADRQAREDVLSRFKYLFVDEYQDVNPAQEAILSCLAGENVFLVGDAKQAIYGFRGSKSEFFTRRTEEFRSAEGAHSLVLSSNFRSAPAVLDAVNRVFSPISEGYVPMSGDKYGAYTGEVRFHVARGEEKEKKERGVYSVLTERETEKDPLAELVADLVCKELTKTYFDTEKGAERPVSFGDIAVLTRKNTGDAERIVAALAARNIPVSTSSKVNVCDFFEARLLIDWLSYLDDPEQDIPMAAAMLSAAGGFTDRDLALIRLKTERALHTPRYTFRDACTAYFAGYRESADNLAKKLSVFYEKTARLRDLMRVKTAPEMIAILLSDGLEAQIAAKGDAAGRLARVGKLTAFAEGCDTHAFLKKLADAQFYVDFSEAGGTDSVQVLTMHASKGLEYPVVILAGMDAPFRLSDRKEEVIFTEKFLIAPKSYDVKGGYVYENLLRRASVLFQERESVSEERNLLYVAMTRARCRLHLVLSDKEHEYRPEHASRFSDFIDIPSFFNLFAEEERKEAPLARSPLNRRADETLVSAILNVYGGAARYPYAQSVLLPVKSSATELMKEEPEKGEYIGHGTTLSVQTGLAYHKFLEHVRFGENAAAELARMTEEGIFTGEELALLDADRLSAILDLPSLRGLGGMRTMREQPFLCVLPACEVYGGRCTDEVIMQGAIDLLVETAQGYLIIDYKYSTRTDESVKEHYKVQLDLYKKAVSRALGVDEKTVRARIVNILQGREIEM